MAEKLAELRQKGGGGYDYANPDKVYQGYVANLASVNFATTKKAKLIVLESNFRGTADNSPLRNLFVFEVGKGGKRAYINNDGMNEYTIDGTGAISGTQIFTVTDNQVTWVNNHSFNVFYTVMIYY